MIEPLVFGRVLAGLLVTIGIAVTMTINADSEAAASPACQAFATAPELLSSGKVETRGGAHCTASTTGLMRVDVSLYQDGDEVASDAKVCPGQPSCGIASTGLCKQGFLTEFSSPSVTGAGDDVITAGQRHTRTAL